MDDLQTKQAIENRYKVVLRKAEDLYSLIWQKGKYTASYRNVRYTRTEAVKRFNSGLALNCGDYAENITAPVLRAMGYKVNIWLVGINCPTTGYWRHWLLKITGNRWTNKIFDGTAAVYKKPFGTPVCPVKSWIFNTGRSIID